LEHHVAYITQQSADLQID